MDSNQIGSRLSTEQALARDSVTGSLVQLLLLLVLAWETSSLIFNVPLYAALCGTIFIFNIGRLILCVPIRINPKFRPDKRWSIAYRIVSIGCGLSWGSTQWALYSVQGLAHPSTLIGFVLLTAVSSACCLSLAPVPWLNRVFIFAILLPPTLPLVFSGNTEDQSVALVLFLYSIFLQAHVNYQVRMNLLARDRESQYHALTKTAFEGVSISRDGIILEATASMLEIFGYQELDFIGLNLIDLVSAEDRDRVRALEIANQTASYEARYVRKDGREFIGESIGRACSYQGTVARVTCVRDITERKRIEENLRESEAKIRATMFKSFDAIPGMVWILNPQGVIQFVNRKTVDYFGPELTLNTRDLGNVVHPEDLQLASELLQRAFRLGEHCESTFRLQRADETYRWHYSVTAPTRDYEGQIINWISVCTDIEDNKRASLDRAQAEYREKMALESVRLKSEFLANMSHEIRTPLNGILGAAEMLAEEDGSAHHCKYVRIIEESGSALMVIINDILDFSKIEAGKLKLENTDFSAINMVEGQAELLLKRATDKNLSLQVFVDPAIPARMQGDPGRLSQVILNLLSNAIKFTSKGTIHVAATCVAVGGDDIRLRFSVRDEGIGIDAETRNMLFQPFTQADTSTARRFGGTGLGLSICKRLVEIMGGEIGVDSELGKGSDFWFTVSLKTCMEDSSDAGLRAGLDGARALIIERDPNYLRLLSSYFSAWGIRQTFLGSLPDPSPEVAKYDIFIYAEEAIRHQEFDYWIEAIRHNPAHIPPRILVLENSHSVRSVQQNLPSQVLALDKSARQSDLYNAILTLLKPAEARIDASEAAVKGSIGLEAIALPDLVESSEIVGAEKPQNFPSPEHDIKAVTARTFESTGETIIPTSNFKILVAEDNSTNQMLALANLRKLGYCAQTVGNGRLALEAIQTGEYDLVLMDCQMPEMDGFTATSHIRELEKLNGGHIPIIALTANAMKEDELHCLASGMDDYISKPVRRQTLKAILDKWLPVEPKDLSA